MSDALAAGVNNARFDSFTLNQTISITRNPFSFVFDFQPGATNVSASPAHSTSITESHASTLSKALQDFFTLDDFSQVDKEAGAAKSNVYVMQDTQAFNFNSSRSDAIIVQESQAFNVSKPDTDSFVVTDTSLLSPRKGISDSVSMGEVINVQPLVASSQLNKGILGFVLLNAD
tara:strand:- start:469 stop:990 length:522 start_codon:yes stop_codon:yes gene_type:complete